MIRALALAICITACSTAGTEPRPDPEADTEEEAPAPPIERFIEPTPEMLAAALTGDPVAMKDAVTILSCNPTSTCPGYGACTGWSGNFECDQTCGPQTCICKPWINPDCIPGDPRGRIYLNQYRVCFDPVGNSCTEWQQGSYSFCGC